MTPRATMLRLFLALLAYNVLLLAAGGAALWPYLFGRSDNALFPMLGYLGTCAAAMFGNGFLWIRLAHGYRSDPFALLVGSFVWGGVGPFFVAHTYEAITSPVVHDVTLTEVRQLLGDGHRTFAMPGCLPDLDALRWGRAEVPRTFAEPDHSLGPRTERAVVAPLRCEGGPRATEPPEVWVGAGRPSDLTLWHTAGVDPHYRLYARTTRIFAYADALTRAPAPDSPIVLEPVLAPELSSRFLAGLGITWLLALLGLFVWGTWGWEPEQPA